MFDEMMEHAVQLAKALDAEDYDAAVKHLARGCLYEFRGQAIEGPKAIIAAYRASAVAARARFDTVRYESSVCPLGTRGARIDFTDILGVAGGAHIHRCAQEVSFDEDGLVSHIRHIDLEGEREALQRFESEHTKPRR